MNEFLIIYSYDLFGGNNHMETSQLFCDANWMTGFWSDMWIKWVISQRSAFLLRSTCNFIVLCNFIPLLVTMQVLVEGFANSNPHCIFLKVLKGSLNNSFFNGVKTYCKYPFIVNLLSWSIRHPSTLILLSKLFFE